jgi:hypothetical protein
MDGQEPYQTWWTDGRMYRSVRHHDNLASNAYCKLIFTISPVPFSDLYRNSGFLDYNVAKSSANSFVPTIAVFFLWNFPNNPAGQKSTYCDVNAHHKLLCTQMFHRHIRAPCPLPSSWHAHFLTPSLFSIMLPKTSEATPTVLGPALTFWPWLSVQCLWIK